MAIEDQIEQLESGIESSYEKVGAKGGTIPAHKNVDNLAGAIDSITIPPEPTGTLNITANGDYDVKSKASAHVDVPSGITPTGTISITDNGQVDVTQYATADVNVSGGGGGIPDQDISFTDIIPSASSNSYTTLSINTTGKTIDNLYIAYVNPGFYWNDSSNNNVANLIGQDGCFHLPVEINNEQFDFKFASTPSTSGSVELYYNTAVTAYSQGYTPTKLDTANAELWNTASSKVTVTNNSVSYTGDLYVVPLEFLNSDFDGVYYKKLSSANLFANTSFSIKDRSSYSVYPASTSIGSIPSRSATGANNTISTGYAARLSDHDFMVGGTYSVPDSGTISAPVKAGFVFLFVKDGHTLQEAATALDSDGFIAGVSDTFYYMDGAEEKQTGYQQNNPLYCAPQPATTKTKWDSIIAQNPNSIDISIPSGDTTGNEFNARVGVSYTKKLSELVGNMTTATFNITDTETWTTRSFKGVVLAEQGVDLNGIDPLSHGGYY